MAQTVSAILAQSNGIAARARRHTGDVNEAGLLVSKVMSQAFRRLGGEETEEVIASAMNRDLDLLLRQRQAANAN